MATPYDIIIIGGGINGCALARHAAATGYHTALVEKNDFGCGVTSRATRLIHGGLRYLESFQVGLVRESLHDRRLWIDDFPGQVEAVPFLIPIYREDRRAPWYIQIGLTMYDFLARDPKIDGHRRLSVADSLARAPGLDSKTLKASFVYYDGQNTYPERVSLEMALQAEEAGATVLNHSPVTELIVENGRCTGVQAGEHELRGRVVINAAGAWIDFVRRLLPGAKEKDDLLTRLNGAHLVVAPFEGGPDCAVYHEARSDGRPFFIVPWRRLLLIGTTETPYDGDPDVVTATEREVDYLLAETNALFPEAKLDRDSILYTYAGSRPLVRATGSNMNSASRGHDIYDHGAEGGPEGLLTLVGGKLTTAPSFARQALATAAGKLGRSAPDRLSVQGSTEGLADAPPRLAEIYGPRLGELRKFTAERPELDRPVAPGAPATAAEVLYNVEREHAVTLADLMLRRTMLAFEPDYAPDWAKLIAQSVSERLQWSSQAVEQQLVAYETELSRTLVRSALVRS